MKARTIWTNTTYLQDKSMQNYIIRIPTNPYHQNTTKNHNQDILSRIIYPKNFGSLLLTLKNAFFNW